MIASSPLETIYAKEKLFYWLIIADGQRSGN